MGWAKQGGKGGPPSNTKQFQPPATAADMMKGNLKPKKGSTISNRCLVGLNAEPDVLGTAECCWKGSMMGEMKDWIPAVTRQYPMHFVQICSWWSPNWLISGLVIRDFIHWSHHPDIRDMEERCYIHYRGDIVMLHVKHSWCFLIISWHLGIGRKNCKSNERLHSHGICIQNRSEV